jgi:hypothetical protein
VQRFVVRTQHVRYRVAPQLCTSNVMRRVFQRVSVQGWLTQEPLTNPVAAEGDLSGEQLRERPVSWMTANGARKSRS